MRIREKIMRLFKHVIMAVLVSGMPSGLLAAFERTDKSCGAVKTAEAWAARSGEAGSLFYNAAGLAGMERKEISFQYSRILAGLENDDLNYLNFMLAIPLRGVNLAGSFNVLTAKIYSEQVLSLAGAGALFELLGRNISLGVRLKYLKIGYGKNEYSELDRLFLEGGYGKAALGADLGLLAYAERGLSIGVSVKEINSPDLTLEGAGERMSPVLQAGFSWRRVFEKNAMAIDEIIIETDIRTKKGGFSFLAGAEPSFFHGTLLPGIGFGWGTDHQRFLTAGLSYRLNIEGISYRLRLIDYILKFTYSFRFDLSGMSEGTWGDHFISASFMF